MTKVVVVVLPELMGFDVHTVLFMLGWDEARISRRRRRTAANTHGVGVCGGSRIRTNRARIIACTEKNIDPLCYNTISR